MFWQCCLCDKSCHFSTCTQLSRTNQPYSHSLLNMTKHVVTSYCCAFFSCGKRDQKTDHSLLSHALACTIGFSSTRTMSESTINCLFNSNRFKGCWLLHVATNRKLQGRECSHHVKTREKARIVLGPSKGIDAVSSTILPLQSTINQLQG